jgi:hypothetical protein
VRVLRKDLGNDKVLKRTPKFIGRYATKAGLHIRRQVGLNRQNCVVGAVGSSFDLDKEIDPLLLAR